MFGFMSLFSNTCALFVKKILTIIEAIEGDHIIFLNIPCFLYVKGKIKFSTNLNYS